MSYLNPNGVDNPFYASKKDKIGTVKYDDKKQLWMVMTTKTTFIKNGFFDNSNRWIRLDRFCIENFGDEAYMGRAIEEGHVRRIIDEYMKQQKDIN